MNDNTAPEAPADLAAVRLTDEERRDVRASVQAAVVERMDPVTGETRYVGLDLGAVFGAVEAILDARADVWRANDPDAHTRNPYRAEAVRRGEGSP